MGAPIAEIMDGRTDLNSWKGFERPAIPDHFGKPFLSFVGACDRLKDTLQ